MATATGPDTEPEAQPASGRVRWRRRLLILLIPVAAIIAASHGLGGRTLVIVAIGLAALLLLGGVIWRLPHLRRHFQRPGGPRPPRIRSPRMFRGGSGGRMGRGRGFGGGSRGSARRGGAAFRSPGSSSRRHRSASGASPTGRGSSRRGRGGGLFRPHRTATGHGRRAGAGSRGSRRGSGHFPGLRRGPGGSRGLRRRRAAVTGTAPGAAARRRRLTRPSTWRRRGTPRPAGTTAPVTPHRRRRLTRPSTWRRRPVLGPGGIPHAAGRPQRRLTRPSTWRRRRVTLGPGGIPHARGRRGYVRRAAARTRTGARRTLSPWTWGRGGVTRSQARANYRRARRRNARQRRSRQRATIARLAGRNYNRRSRWYNPASWGIGSGPGIRARMSARAAARQARRNARRGGLISRHRRPGLAVRMARMRRPGYWAATGTRMRARWRRWRSRPAPRQLRARFSLLGRLPVIGGIMGRIDRRRASRYTSRHRRTRAPGISPRQRPAPQVPVSAEAPEPAEPLAAPHPGAYAPSGSGGSAMTAGAATGLLEGLHQAFQQLSQWDPDTGLEIDGTLLALPEVFTTGFHSLRNLAERLGAEKDVDQAVVAEMQSAAAALHEVGESFGQVYAQHRVSHEDKMRRIEEQPVGGEIWDQGRNR